MNEPLTNEQIERMVGSARRCFFANVIHENETLVQANNVCALAAEVDRLRKALELAQDRPWQERLRLHEQTYDT